MRHPNILHATSAVLLLSACLSSCAGATARVRADQAQYPISMSPVIRQHDGVLLEKRSLRKLARFELSSSSVAVAYSHLPTGELEISEEVNKQVKKAGGEAIVNLTVSSGTGCDVLNGFPVLNILPVWPGCVPVTVTGDIVKRSKK